MTTKDIMGITILLCIFVSAISSCLFIATVFGAEWGWLMVFCVFTGIGVAVSLEYRRNYGNGE